MPWSFFSANCGKHMCSTFNIMIGGNDPPACSILVNRSRIAGSTNKQPQMPRLMSQNDVSGHFHSITMSFNSLRSNEVLSCYYLNCKFTSTKMPKWIQWHTFSHSAKNASNSNNAMGLSRYPGPGHWPANAASLCMVPEPGTNYRQPSDCQNCRYLQSSASSRPASSSTSAVLVVAVSRIYRRLALLQLTWVWCQLQMSRLDSTQVKDCIKHLASFAAKF